MDYSMWAIGILVYLGGTCTGLHFGWRMGWRRACDEIIQGAELELLRNKVAKMGGDNGV